MVLHCGWTCTGTTDTTGSWTRAASGCWAGDCHNDLGMVLGLLEPYRESLLEGVVVESTFNWYWLADGLRDHGYRVRLPIRRRWSSTAG